MEKSVLSGDENPISAVIIDEESLDRLFLENGTLDHQKIESTFRQNVLAKHSQNMAIILNWLRCYFEGNDFEGFAKKCLELVCPQDLQIKDQHNQCLLQWASLKNYHQVIKNMMPIIKNAYDERDSDSIKIAWGIAAANGFEETCSLLMPYLNYQGIHQYGSIALKKASKRNYSNTIRAVLDYKSRIQQSMNLSQREQLAHSKAVDKHVILMAFDMNEREVLQNLVDNFWINGLENSRGILQKSLNDGQMRVTQWLLKQESTRDFYQHDEDSIFTKIYNADMPVFKYIFNELLPFEKEYFKKYLAELRPEAYEADINYLMKKALIMQKNIVIDNLINVKEVGNPTFIDCIKDLYSRGLISISQKLSIHSQEMTLLEWACYEQVIDLVKNILKSLKKPNKIRLYRIYDCLLRQCMGYACLRGKRKSLDIVKLLVKKGKEILRKFDLNQTILNGWAISIITKEMGFSLPDRTLWGRGIEYAPTVLEIACHTGDFAVARYLVSEGVDINWRRSLSKIDFRRLNALRATIISKEHEKYDIAQFLLDHGIDTLINSFNSSCMKVAIESVDERMVSILLKHREAVMQLQKSPEGAKNLLFRKIIKHFTPKKDIGVQVLKVLLGQRVRKFSVFAKQTSMWSRFSYYFGSEDILLDFIKMGLEMVYSEKNGPIDSTDVVSLLSAEIKEAKSLPCNQAEKDALLEKSKFLKELSQMVYGCPNKTKDRRERDFIVAELKHQLDTKDKISDKELIQENVNLFRENSENVIKAIYVRAFYEKLQLCKSDLLREYLRNHIFDRRFLSPSLYFRLCVNKLGMWKVYQQGDNNMGVVALSRRLGVEAAKQERVGDFVEKRVSEFLTYDDIQRLRDHSIVFKSAPLKGIRQKDHSIVFGRYGMNAIPKSAIHPVSGDGGSVHKRQKVGSSTHSDEGMHQNGSSSSSCSSSLKDHSVNMMRQT